MPRLRPAVPTEIVRRWSAGRVNACAKSATGASAAGVSRACASVNVQGCRPKQQVAGDRVEPARARGFGRIVLEAGDRLGADLDQRGGAQLDG